MVDHGKSTKRKKFHDKDKYYKRKSDEKRNEIEGEMKSKLCTAFLLLAKYVH
jgi:hypothetical protein